MKTEEMKKRNRFRDLALVASTLLALGVQGCAGLGRTLEPPRAQLANITVQEVRGFETVIQLDLRLFNTNSVPIDIEGIDCDLEINGKQLASGVSKTETRIPAYETATLPITVYSSVLEIFRRAMELPGKEKVDYTVKGRLYLKKGTYLYPKIPFTSTGRISLPTPPDQTGRR